MPLLEEKKKIGPPVKLTNTSIANARNAPPGRGKKKKKGPQIHLFLLRVFLLRIVKNLIFNISKDYFIYFNISLTIHLTSKVLLFYHVIYIYIYIIFSLFFFYTFK